MKILHNTMTQEEAVMSYIKYHKSGYIIPAKMTGKTWRGTFFGSEISRACRSLREQGYLKSKLVDKFAVYTPTKKKYARV